MDPDPEAQKHADPDPAPDLDPQHCLKLQSRWTLPHAKSLKRRRIRIWTGVLLNLYLKRKVQSLLKLLEKDFHKRAQLLE